MEKKEGRLSKIFLRISLKNKMLFARHMAVMTRSGLQIIDSLELLKKQTRAASFRRVLESLISDVRNGQFLSMGLEKYRNVFGEFFINLVRVGETSGTLAENFAYLADELKKKQELDRKVKGAMIYPVIILIATVGIVSMLTFFIFPKILPIFESLSAELPLATRAFIAISNFLLSFGIWVILGLVVLGIIWSMLLRLPSVRYVWHRTILRIPLISSMSKTVNIINFSRTISTLLNGGISIVEALEITADTLPNVIYRQELKKIADEVRHGDPVSKHLTENHRLFPPIFAQMIAVGENTGKLDETALYLAGFYEEELDGATKTFSTILEPVLLLIMGLLVGFVAIAIISPIYSITQSLGR